MALLLLPGGFFLPLCQVFSGGTKLDNYSFKLYFSGCLSRYDRLSKEDCL